MQVNKFTTGMIAGIIVGSAVNMMVNPTESRGVKSMRRSVGKTMRAIGHVVDSFS